MSESDAMGTKNAAITEVPHGIRRTPSAGPYEQESRDYENEGGAGTGLQCAREPGDPIVQR
jgi:hypothetical protein